jgi:hypothetical protein
MIVAECGNGQRQVDDPKDPNPPLCLAAPLSAAAAHLCDDGAHLAASIGRPEIGEVAILFSCPLSNGRSILWAAEPRVAASNRQPNRYMCS